MVTLSYNDGNFLEMLFCEDYAELFMYAEFHVPFMRIHLAEWQWTGINLQLSRLRKRGELEQLTEFILNV
jgi:hypothetical protein